MVAAPGSRLDFTPPLSRYSGTLSLPTHGSTPLNAGRPCTDTVGFEPTRALAPLVFEASAFVRSATYPDALRFNGALDKEP